MKASANVQERLLNSHGPFFELNRMGGSVEFGATAKLTTRLSDSTPELISEWLEDGRGLALSIWDPVEDLGGDKYRLKVMKLQFVTLQLAPSVDVEMKTVNGVFKVKSVDFDPNIQVLPGMRIKADALGIVINVVGELKPSQGGVSGRIAFGVEGKLPPPLRLLPPPALKAASDSINQTIVNFAVASFEKGATANFRKFLQQKQQ